MLKENAITTLNGCGLNVVNVREGMLRDDGKEMKHL